MQIKSKEALLMQIGEVIRKYRKMRHMTQEERANRLGVTAPAVNKWKVEIFHQILCCWLLLRDY